eukprot:scaffold72009_cov60-Phaeocystis_antarctica.AAC.4
MDFRTMAMKNQSSSSPLRLARGLSRRQTMPTQKWAELSAAAHARPFMVQIGANDHSQDKDGGDIAPRLLQRGCTSALNQAQIHEIDPSDGPCGSGGRYQPTWHMSGVYTPSGGR